MLNKRKLFFAWIFSFVTSPFVMASVNMNISTLRIIIVSIVMTPIWILSYYKWSDNIERRNAGPHMRESAKNTDFINVPGISEKVKTCCFQTARLGDGYCICGRAISRELKQNFSQ